jgi:hypothetical protein
MSLKDAIAEYDEELVKRGSAEVIAARENGLMMHNWDQFMQSAVVQQGAAKTEVK